VGSYLLADIHAREHVLSSTNDVLHLAYRAQG
jgi:hypothetical protein